MQCPGDLIERLREHGSQPGIDLCVLFGSHATGCARPGSDVDVALLLSDDSPAAMRHAEIHFQRALHGKADVTFLNVAAPQLRFEIARSGALVFERQAGIWVREPRTGWPMPRRAYRLYEEAREGIPAIREFLAAVALEAGL